jgi:hypothetical protein
MVSKWQSLVRQEITSTNAIIARICDFKKIIWRVVLLSFNHCKKFGASQKKKVKIELDRGWGSRRNGDATKNQFSSKKTKNENIDPKKIRKNRMSKNCGDKINLKRRRLFFLQEFRPISRGKIIVILWKNLNYLILIKMKSFYDRFFLTP